MTHMMMTIQRAIESTGAAQATRAQILAAGVTERQIRRALATGDLREGLCGYWLPAPPDPGAITVMRAAMRERTEE